MCASVRGVRAVVGTQDDQEEGCYFLLQKQQLQPRSHKRSEKAVPHSSDTAEAVLQALAFVPMFFFSSHLLYLHFSFLSLPRHNSDPASLFKQALLPLPRYGTYLLLYRENVSPFFPRLLASNCVPVVTVYFVCECVAGAQQQQEVEPRQC